jgi:GNAT superfamily N-acetyltransferase
MIETVTAAALPAALEGLAEVLHGCVHAGASVGFVLPFPVAEAREFYAGLAPSIASGKRVLLAARVEGRIAGTAQLVADTLPNGRHRADVAKVLVHPAFRRRGIAAALMREVEARALAMGRTLLVLDTHSDSPAETLYEGLGYVRAGRVPNFAAVPEGALISTTFMYKELGPHAA